MDFYAYCMELLRRAALVGGLTALLITAPASGSAFAVDGSAIIELDTTGLLDTGADQGGGGGGGASCTPTAEISSIGNGAMTSAGTYTTAWGLGYFEFNSGSFPVVWNPDTCGLSGGSLSLTDFKTEASVNGNWMTVYAGMYFNGLPGRESNSGVYNLDAIDGNNPNGTLHKVASNPTISTAVANLGSTTTNVNITETLSINGTALPNYRYVTTATFSVIADQ